ncbi:S8 family serine peptidase [Novosphingobium sp. G106]|uniref:S8 family serine peptidase n=1 Tax=Novosphingobium sp. G106 TaxID=2849500 RepID=UPI001C2CD0DD|nr:S8 family serine peptidase [Novosphingobium sp. G106]MBV1686353.1 S8 family serine peptidase [Novosphingobium sp. G106]
MEALAAKDGDGEMQRRRQVLVRRNFVSAAIPVSALKDLERDPEIAFVHPSEPLTLDRPTVVRNGGPAPTPRTVGDAALIAEHKDGQGVIVGIIDVGGFDFAHEDFLDAQGKTRFLSIWDQGGDSRKPPSGNRKTRFDYGSELTAPLLNAAIAAEKAGEFPATYVERQSQSSEGSHGTHVASIAAGNAGVCPKAEIAAVLISVPLQNTALEERRATFTDTTRIVDAVEYLLEIAAREKKPISINISLGTNGAAHDGSNGVSRWLDALLSTPGRAISVAAGNAGQQKALSDDDLGFVMGRIHASGQIAASGLAVDLEWTVIGNGMEDMSENELEIWYGAQDRLTVMLKAPGSSEWITVKPCEYVENRRLPSGTTVSIYNELYHPTNGANYAAIYLTPNLDRANLRGVASGVWTVRLVGEEVRDGRFDCWIERDDPIDVGSQRGVRLIRFPSFFSEESNVDSHSISSLACGHRVIAVANLDETKQRINASSSQGPTRDRRCKPEVSAPGTDIVAAKGFSEDGKAWLSMTGTSMASPYVTGVVGLMLAVNPDLTSAQCSGILQRTAKPLPGASYSWANDAGFGVIDAAAAVAEARTFSDRREV